MELQSISSGIVSLHLHIGEDVRMVLRQSGDRDVDLGVCVEFRCLILRHDDKR